MILTVTKTNELMQNSYNTLANKFNFDADLLEELKDKATLGDLIYLIVENRKE